MEKLPSQREQQLLEALEASEQRTANFDLINDLDRSTLDLIKRRTQSMVVKPAPKPTQALLPPEKLQSLQDVAHHAFPRRMDLPVLVCDIRKDGSSTFNGRVNNIESCTYVYILPCLLLTAADWKEKPADVVVRWM